METKDWIVVSVSAAALLWSISWSIISYYLNKASSSRTSERADEANALARRAGERADEANALARETGRRLTAETELSLIRLINEARMRTNELNVKYRELEGRKIDSKLSAEQKQQMMDMTWEALDVAVEILLNSYELACGMYLDGGKLDDERFERQYREEIKLLFKFPKPYENRLHAVDSQYNAIRAVRDKWCNPEKK